MKTYRMHLFAAFALGVSGLHLPASAESLQPYDPVARAIALGLTPEALDAAFDTALAQAETCDAADTVSESVSCPPRDIAVNDMLQSPILNAGS